MKLVVTTNVHHVSLLEEALKIEGMDHVIIAGNTKDGGPLLRQAGIYNTAGTLTALKMKDFSEKSGDELRSALVMVQ